MSTESIPEESKPQVVRNEACFKFFESLGSPKMSVAPMVDGSELPFRMLCRKYGAQMAWSPMIHSKLFVTQKKHRAKAFSTCPEDRPLAIQFCANDPELLLQAAKLVEHQCDAIDINFGCPQQIAKRGNYGAFLCDQWDVVESLVSTLHKNLSIPVFCKIRRLETYERTLEYAKMIERAGCSLLTVHGRTKEQRGVNQGVADWKLIKYIKDNLSIPVLANGNIRCFEDIQNCLAETGADGMMSACELLVNPALFSNTFVPPCQLGLEYVEFAEKYPVEHHLVRGHLHKIMKNVLAQHVDLREELNKCRTIGEMKVLVQKLTERAANSESMDEVVESATEVPVVQEVTAIVTPAADVVIADVTTNSADLVSNDGANNLSDLSSSGLELEMPNPKRVCYQGSHDA